MSDAPLTVTLWKEGAITEQLDAIAVDFDGDQVSVMTDDEDNALEGKEWDELTVQYT